MEQSMYSLQKQQQILSQNQIQFLQLLTMSNQELDLWMNQQYNENPLLERGESSISMDHFETLPQETASSDFEYSPYLETSFSRESKRHEPSFWEGQDLFHHLTEQLCYRDYTKLEWKAIHCLIGNLEKNGFFTTDLSALSLENGIPLPVLEKCLQILKTLEPCGIFSSNIQDCCLTQLRRNGHTDSLLTQILMEDFEALLYKKYSTLYKKYKISSETVCYYHRLLADLYPYPLFDPPQNIVIYPEADIIYTKEQDKWHTSLSKNPQDTYVLSSYYLHCLHSTKNPELRYYLWEKYKTAKNVLHNITQRNQTLLRIADAILEKQKDFFENHDFLVPMSMREIAADCNLSISTISRAVSNKNIQYSKGIIPLRSLFTASSESTPREDSSLSPAEAKKAIAHIISLENPESPLKDEAIASRLREQAIFLSRRTVAKYRTELLIPTSRERRIRKKG